MTKDKKQVTVSFRMTETENELFRELVKANDNKTLSAFIRSNVLSLLDRVTDAR